MRTTMSRRLVVSSAITLSCLLHCTAGAAERKSSPYGGKPWQIPGRIEAENYDEGGEGLAYHDQDEKNQGREHRPKEGVDVAKTGDAGGGYHVGWFRGGEWLQYTVNVTAGKYDLHLRLASAGTTLALTLDGKPVGTLKVAPTGWDNWQTITLPGVSLPGGENQVLRLTITGKFGINLNWFEFAEPGKGPPAAASPNTKGGESAAVPKKKTAKARGKGTGETAARPSSTEVADTTGSNELLHALSFETQKAKVEKTNAGVRLIVDKKTGKWTNRGVATAKVQAAQEAAALRVRVAPGTASVSGLSLGCSTAANSAVCVLIRSRLGMAVIQQYEPGQNKPTAEDERKGAKAPKPGKDDVLTLAVDLKQKTITFNQGKFTAEVPLKIKLDRIDTIGLFGVNGSDSETVDVAFEAAEYATDAEAAKLLAAAPALRSDKDPKEKKDKKNKSGATSGKDKRKADSSAGVAYSQIAGDQDPFPGMNVPKAVDSAKITGAKVDESRVQQVLHVDVESAVAADGNPGTAEEPLKTFRAALEKATELLKQGTGVKILLHSGVYRESSFVIDGNQIGGEAAETVLVIEGAGKDRAIFSGSMANGWEPATWQVVDAQKKIYKHAWPYNWGPTIGGYYKPANVIGHRREMVFLNGRPLTQALIEQVEWRRPTSEEFDQYGLKKAPSKPAVKGPSAKYADNLYIYKGYLGPQVLEAGQFGVAELGPDEKIHGMAYEGHPDPNTIFIRLPDEIPSLDGVKVEVTMAIDRPDQPLWIQNKSNFVMRNLVFEHYGLDCNRSVLRTQGYAENTSKSHDWLIEDCQWRFNNGRGVGLAWINGLTVRRCACVHNGGVGFGLNYVRNTRIEELDASWNTWRNAQADFHDHACGGIDWMGKDLLFSRCRAAHNATGFGCRGDITGVNIIFEDCKFNDNSGLNGGGVFFEIMTGPLLLRNCEISHNGRGLLNLNNYNVTLDRCTLADNKDAGIVFGIMKNRKTQDSFGTEFRRSVPIPGIRNIAVIGCTITSNCGDSSLIYSGGMPEEEWYRNDLKLSGNYYFNKDSTQVFGTGRGRQDTLDFAGWKALTGQEHESRWSTTPK